MLIVFCLLFLQLCLSSVWPPWTGGSVQPQFLGIITTLPPRRVRSSPTRAAEGASTTLSQSRAAWMCVFEVCEQGVHAVQVSSVKLVRLKFGDHSGSGRGNREGITQLFSLSG